VERNIVTEVGVVRLNALRALYLFMAIGLAATVWPNIVAPGDTVANSGTVVRALLGALVPLWLVGLRHPLRMLPLLMFELLWKLIWVLVFALGMWLHQGLDGYASETLFECLFGIVLVPLAMPWGYVFRTYVKGPGEPWRRRTGQP
jgi:hypothetical protein